jgi:hypothetical protein
MSEIHELADKLQSEGEKFYSLFAGLTDDQWNLEVYTEGATWTIRNVLAHFVTAERGLVKLFERIRVSGEGAADDFSIDRYNAAQQEKTKNLSPQELLEQYKEVRSDSVAWTLSISDDDLEKEGRHPYLGFTKIRDMLKTLYVHNQLHYRDMKKVLK